MKYMAYTLVVFFIPMRDKKNKMAVIQGFSD